MQKPPQITFKNMPTAPALETLIMDRIGALEKLYPRIIGCRVVVEVPHRSANGAKVPLGIAVEVEVPNRNTVVAKSVQERRDAKQDQTAAVSQAFDAVARQLGRIADEQARDIRTSEADQQTGMIVGLFSVHGYGFVEIDNSPELYFTRNAVVSGSFDELEVGMMVHVTKAMNEGPMGPQASSIRLHDRAKSPD